MNPVIYRIGSLEIRAFAWALLIPLCIGAGVLAWSAHRRGERVMRWLDAGLGTVVGGALGARAVYLLLEWRYYTLYPAQVWSLGGGLDWHGAALGGFIGGWIVCRLRGVPFAPFLAACAWVVPLLAFGIQTGCDAAACGYGSEVRTLADYPALLVTEAPDVYGTLAPRWNLPLISTGYAVLVLAAVAVAGSARFWVALLLLSGYSYIANMFSGQPREAIFAGLSADRALDVLVFAFALFGLLRSFAARQSISAKSRMP